LPMSWCFCGTRAVAVPQQLLTPGGMQLQGPGFWPGGLPFGRRARRPPLALPASRAPAPPACMTVNRHAHEWRDTMCEGCGRRHAYAMGTSSRPRGMLVCGAGARTCPFLQRLQAQPAAQPGRKQTARSGGFAPQPQAPPNAQELDAVDWSRIRDTQCRAHPGISGRMGHNNAESISW
jgi:hypothetical protein